MDETKENNAENTMSSTVRSVGDAAASAAERMSDTLEQGRAALEDIQTAVVERTRECVETTDAYVRDNPWQAIGIAAGLGLVVGLLMRRR